MYELHDKLEGNKEADDSTELSNGIDVGGDGMPLPSDLNLSDPMEQEESTDPR